jgi:hypothetical protein
MQIVPETTELGSPGSTKPANTGLRNQPVAIESRNLSGLSCAMLKGVAFRSNGQAA